MIRTKITVIMLFLFILSGPAFAEHNASITDYDTTVSGAMETRLAASYTKTTALDFDNIATDYTSNGKYTLDHNNFYDSLDNSWAYALHAEQQETGSLTSSPTDTYKHLYSASGAYNVYFLPEKEIFHGFGAYYSTRNDWTSNGPGTESATTDIYYNIGYGHVIDITPMAEAGNLEDRLMEVNALKSRLSRAELLQLAEIIRKWRMNEYTYKDQDTGKGMFLEDLTKVLQASGKLNGPLDGFSFWRISDSRVVNYTRSKGMIVACSVNNNDTYTLDHTAGSSHSNDINNYGTINFSYYWPLDWRSQLKLDMDYDKAFNPNDVFPVDSSYASLSYTYDLTNNFWAELMGLYMRENRLSAAAGDNSPNSGRGFILDLNYKVEDHWYLSMQYAKIYYDSWNMRDILMLTNNFYW